MPRQCCVPTCNNGRSAAKLNLVAFHKLPSDPLRRREWLIKCQIYEIRNPNRALICSDHFRKSDYLSKSKNPSSRKLKPRALPTKRLPTDFYYIKKQEAVRIVVDADPIPLLENDDTNLSVDDSTMNDNLLYRDEDVLLSDLKRDLSLPVRPPLAVKNDILSNIHYDHSYAIPFPDHFLQKTYCGVNNTFNGNRKFERTLFTNEVGTMTEMLGSEVERLHEFEREIRWLWQRNQKMQDSITLLIARNRELVCKNLRTRKELHQKTEKVNDLKKRLTDSKQNCPKIKIEPE